MIGFFTRIVLTASSNGCSDSVLQKKVDMSTTIHITVGRSKHSPFLWGNHFHDTRLHSILINLLDKGLEIAELVHCLGR